VSFLLDTHAFLWSVLEPKRLGEKSRAVVAEPANEVFVSAVTFWEISLKVGLGKLKLEGCRPETLLEAARAQAFKLLPLSPEDASTFHHLPRTGHRDPFDRMLIWQAIRGSHTLITQDSGIRRAYRAHRLATLW
jgi:PIN domain nuclease of toxin-antitoxin system